MNRILIVRAAVLFGISAGLAAISGCDKQEGPPKPAGGGFAAAVTAIPAIGQDVPIYIDEIGHITASEAVSVQPQVSGKIISRKFVDGADLKKNDLLFEIDPRPFQAALEQSQGQLAKDQAMKASSDWNVNQDTAALETKAISQQQLHNDTASRDQAAASIAVDQAAIDYAKLNVEYCSITAPTDGRAGARLIDVGNVVTAAGQAPGTNLLSIQKCDPIYADFTVNEAQLAMVRRYMAQGELQTQVMLPEETSNIASLQQDTAVSATQPSGGAPASMPAATTAPITLHTGKLIFLDNSVQDGTGTVKLRAELANADRHFWPGQFVNVRLILTIKHDAVLVPTQATQVSQQGLYVYVVQPDPKDAQKQIAHQRVVTVGQRHGDLSVIDAGLNVGEEVIITGQQLVMPESAVMVVNPQPKPMTAPSTQPVDAPAVEQKMAQTTGGKP